MTSLECGSCEGVKKGVHIALMAIAGLCAMYNAAAWLQRHERHLAANAIGYGLLVAFETHVVLHHHRRPPPLKGLP